MNTLNTSRNRHSGLAMRWPSVRVVACVAWAMILLPGCFNESVTFDEVKRIDEKITDAELKKFFRVIESLPDRELPPMSPSYADPPEWQESRTLAVSELVAEEQGLIEDRTSVEWIAKPLRRKRGLVRLFRRENLTPDQFVGLTQAIGIAFSRTTLRDNQDLESIVEKGDKEIRALRRDDRPFSELALEEQHAVLQRAMWITRLDRAKRLTQVPPENRALIDQHRDELLAVLPREFTTNPLDAVTDLLEEKGIPFEELPESGSDEYIEWDSQNALRGHDLPDTQLRKASDITRTIVPPNEYSPANRTGILPEDLDQTDRR